MPRLRKPAAHTATLATRVRLVEELEQLIRTRGPLTRGLGEDVRQMAESSVWSLHHLERMRAWLIVALDLPPGAYATPAIAQHTRQQTARTREDAERERAEQARVKRANWDILRQQY